MALSFGVSKLVLRHVHYESRDRTYRSIRTRARPRPVLTFLVVRFPLQPKRDARLLALLRPLHQAVHLVLFHTATYGEPTIYDQQCCHRTQCRHISKLPASLQKTQDRYHHNKRF